MRATLTRSFRQAIHVEPQNIASIQASRYSSSVPPALRSKQADQMSQSEAHPVSAEERSVQARSRGNDLYRKGLFDAATKAYFEAVTLSRNDPAPLSNLSAVQFELGNYAGSQLYAEKALKLLQSEADTSPKKQKLFLRLAKAKLLMLQDAKSVASRLDSADSLHKSVAAMSRSKTNSTSWTKLLDELPRYRPSL